VSVFVKQSVLPKNNNFCISNRFLQAAGVSVVIVFEIMIGFERETEKNYF